MPPAQLRVRRPRARVERRERAGVPRGRVRCGTPSTTSPPGRHPARDPRAGRRGRAARHRLAPRAPAGLHGRQAHLARKTARPTPAAHPSSMSTAGARSRSTDPAKPAQANPIVRLPDHVKVVDGDVRRVEEALIGVCADLGVEHGPRPRPQRGVAPRPRAHAPERKIAALGIRVSRGVTMHGFALNCDVDLSWYDRFVPCGIADAGVTSLTARARSRRHRRSEVLPSVRRHLTDLLAWTPYNPDARLRAAPRRAGSRPARAGARPIRLTSAFVRVHNFSALPLVSGS